jgi:hypothetical protein
MIPVVPGWLPRRRRPAPPPVPAETPKPLWEQLAEEIVGARAQAPDLLAESEQREAGASRAAKGLQELGPPGLGAGLGARLDGGPDPLVFGDPRLQAPRPGYARHSCECGVSWGADDPVCWNCGTKVTQ